MDTIELSARLYKAESAAARNLAGAIDHSESGFLKRGGQPLEVRRHSAVPKVAALTNSEEVDSKPLDAFRERAERVGGL
jgi:hypothetical protein